MSYAQAEREYYSDRLREQRIAECEWHEGYPKNDCQDCDALYEMHCENLMDADREDRIFYDD